MRVIMVLKAGGDYGPAHVRALAQQVSHYHPAAEIVCLTDLEVKIDNLHFQKKPLRYGWPGWWSKMELYSDALEGDVFYIDLDTVITGPLTGLDHHHNSLVLSDFYKPTMPASGILLIKQRDKAPIWDFFIKNAAKIMATYKTRDHHGDQGVLRHFDAAFDRWQDVHPGRVVSYKVHVKPNGFTIPAGASVVCFHGKPRPWAVKHEWSPDYGIDHTNRA